MTGFPKVKWPQLTGEVGNLQADDVKFSKDFTLSKIYKFFNSNSKINMWIDF